jgi:site-specific recombinase XerD
MGRTGTLATIHQLRPDPGADTFDRELERWDWSIQSDVAPQTLAAYKRHVAGFRAFLEAEGRSLDPASWDRETAAAYKNNLTARGLKVTTRRVRFVAVALWCKWLADPDQDVIHGPSPFLGVKPPTVRDVDVETPLVSDDAWARLLATTNGRSYADVRDRAILLTLYDTGARRAESVGIALEDLEMGARQVVLHGKGAKRRWAHFGPDTAKALAAYLRLRDTHRDRDLVVSFGDRSANRRDGRPLFLVTPASPGNRGGLGDSGLYYMIRRRCAEAGIPTIHPHQFRHTWADALGRSGVQDGELMVLGGWTNRAMLDRYGKAGKESRARAAYRSPVDAWRKRS